MISPSILLFSVSAYLLFLFIVAFMVERHHDQGKNYTGNTLVYVLSLAVYCTAWTFYGNIGLAASSSFLFLAVYIGPTLAFLLWAGFLRKLIRLRNEYNITSIADFISIRYGKSSLVAAIASLIAVIGIVPYLALQLKAISTSYALVSTGSTSGSASFGVGMTLLVVIIVFTIVFGFRRLDQAERHPGVIMAVAVQSVVKLVAFLCAGIFITYFLHGGFGDLFSRVNEANLLRLQAEPHAPSYSLFLSYLILSMSAIIFLPRQFHVTVIENVNEKHVRHATWLLPIYFILITLFVIPIALAGLLQGYDLRLADLYMLLLSLDFGSAWLTILIFIGGLSAGMSMIMVSTITMTTMVSNHLVLPFFEKIKIFHFLRRYLLPLRWVLVMLLLSLAFAFERTIGSSYVLVKIGMISFAAMLQFAPVIIGSLFWRQGSKLGAILGMSGGFLAWLYTAILPALVKSGWVSPALLSDGPFSIGYLRPEHLFGITSLDPLAHIVLVTLTVNVSLYIIGSLFSEQSKEEQRIADTFLMRMKSRRHSISSVGQQSQNIAVLTKVALLTSIFDTYLNHEQAKGLVGRCFAEANLQEKGSISLKDLIHLKGVAERLLANYIGTATASVALAEGGFVTEEESADLSGMYAQMATRLQLTPEEFIQKIDFYTEKERLVTEQKEKLETMVEERTRKLEETNAELRSINDVTIGRELRMIELKEQIKELESRIASSAG